MRLLLLGLVVACTGDDGSNEHPPPDAPDHAMPGPVLDGGVDAALPDAPAVPTTIFQSATIGAGTFRPLPARSCDGWQPMVGVRVTTTHPHTITALGAQVHRTCEACQTRTMFMAIVPLDPVTSLPKTADLGDAIGKGFAEVAYVPSTTLDAPPPSITFPASFELPAGTWGLVVGSNALGVPSVEAALSFDVERVGEPRYFVYSADSSRWIHAQVSGGDNRFFIEGY